METVHWAANTRGKSKSRQERKGQTNWSAFRSGNSSLPPRDHGVDRRGQGNPGGRVKNRLIGHPGIDLGGIPDFKTGPIGLGSLELRRFLEQRRTTSHSACQGPRRHKPGLAHGTIERGPVKGHEFRVLLDIFSLPIFQQERGASVGLCPFQKKWSKRSRQIP